jgi:hypothetical protein
MPLLAKGLLQNYVPFVDQTEARIAPGRTTLIGILPASMQSLVTQPSSRWTGRSGAGGTAGQRRAVSSRANPGRT